MMSSSSSPLRYVSTVREAVLPTPQPILPALWPGVGWPSHSRPHVTHSLMSMSPLSPDSALCKWFPYRAAMFSSIYTHFNSGDEPGVPTDRCRNPRSSQTFGGRISCRQNQPCSSLACPVQEVAHVPGYRSSLPASVPVCRTLLSDLCEEQPQFGYRRLDTRTR